jgi:hypothetical protein
MIDTHMLQCLELNVVLCMASTDRRFGFSVVGGVDEGLTPRVDDIQPGKCEVSHNSALHLNFSFSQMLL